METGVESPSSITDLEIKNEMNDMTNTEKDILAGFMVSTEPRNTPELMESFSNNLSSPASITKNHISEIETKVPDISKNQSAPNEMMVVEVQNPSSVASIPLVVEVESRLSTKPDIHPNQDRMVTETASPKKRVTTGFALEIIPLNDNNKSPKKILSQPDSTSPATYDSLSLAGSAHSPSGSDGPQSLASFPAVANTLKPLKRREKSEAEVIIGTPVKEGHVNYMLMYDMLTGIRISVSRCNAKNMREIVDSDFIAAHKLAFDVVGNEMTPSSKYDFKFKDYCPWVFRMIREAFHIDPAYYLLSLTGKYVLSELVSSGKSGSFFYYSQDYRFIIKTIHHSEHKFILKILRFYYQHIKNNPHTLLSRIFGLHRVKLPGNRKIHFVVMGNVFPSNKDIHEVYDLKGSLYGRYISEEEANSNPRAVMKDLNWNARKKKLILGPQKRALFLRQMEVDVSFLMSQEIMDYSLLIGVHDAVRGNEERIRDQTLSVFEPNSDALSRRATAISRKTKTQIFNNGVKADLVQLGPSTSKLPENIPPERRYCFFYSDEGGFRGSLGNDLPSNEIYYLGIIDIFTFYSPAKRMETVLRSIGRDKMIISAVDPTTYGNRFKRFITSAIQGESPVMTEEQEREIRAVLAVPSGSFVALPI